MKAILPAVVLTGLVLSAIAAPQAPIVVFAAASLTDCLTEIGRRYQQQTGQAVRFNFGASSVLSRQIQEGAPADLFFSADEARMDRLEIKGLLLPGTRKSRLSNSLVIIVERGSPLRIESAWDLTNRQVARIALADPLTVPAGIYARQYLQKLGLWQRLKAKVIPTDNVRAALAAVESGNVEAGFVYKTDAAISAAVKVAFWVPPQQGPPISYPMAVIKGSRHWAAARQFEKFLLSSQAGELFEKFGFIVRK